MTFKPRVVKRLHVDDAKLRPNVCNNLKCNAVLRGPEDTFQLRQGNTRFLLCRKCFGKFITTKPKPRMFRGLI